MRWREPAPGEQEAGVRSWEVVRHAYDERVRVPRRRDYRPLVVLAAGVAILAAAFSPPGLAVWGSLRDAVQKEDHLVALPANGRVLVEADEGVWVVSRDGSKRFLSGYSDASWSPHGLYVAAARANQLVAMEPDGDVHWKLARRGRVSSPQWSYDGYRIAYFVGGALRVVNGDGTGDRLLTRAARPGPLAWQPGMHALAYVNRRGDIQIANVDVRNRSATVQTRSAPTELAWTSDARRLVAIERHELEVFWPRGPRSGGLQTNARVAAVSLSPDGKRAAFIETRGRRSSLRLTGILGGPTTTIFNGAGTFSDVEWSPDGRWLLLEWDSADQWLFVRTPVRKLVAVSNIRATYGDRPSLAGWCCP
jgi:Tol biopolymer transport system component